MPSPLDLGPARAVYDEIEEQVGRGATAPRPSRSDKAARVALKRALGDALRGFARRFGFEVHIPGRHAGGISNQDLFDLLAERGWEYAADTKRLRDFVRVTLLAEFEDEPVVPLAFEVEQVAAGAVLEWIARRLDRAVSDIDRPALSPQYARAKRKRFGTGRAGSASGELADAARTRGRITLT